MKTIFTTNEVAKICKVAPRTVSKWFDSGRLRGYRIPGSQDRRIPREHLIRFFKEHGMPLGDLESVDEIAEPEVSIGPDEKLRRLEPLLSEVNRRAEKEAADELGCGFTVTIEPELWAQVKDFT